MANDDLPAMIDALVARGEASLALEKSLAENAHRVANTIEALYDRLRALEERVAALEGN